MKTRGIAAALVAGTALLTGCGGSSSAFCGAVEDDLGAAAVVFNPVIFGTDTGAASVEQRIAFMDEVERPPEGLESEWTTFRNFLNDLAASPGQYVAEPDDVAAARDALFDAQMECRD